MKSLMSIRSDKRWGLTGTPSVSTVEQVCTSANLFRVDLIGRNYLSESSRYEISLSKNVNDNCDRFVKLMMRQNADQEVDMIKQIDHVVSIKHT